jgi:hypothetical protein
MPGKGGSWPVIRTNALPITEFPSVCRRVQSEVGGTRELRSAVETAGASDELLVTRTNAGVLAFGSDEALRRSLNDHGITQTDLHTIDSAKLSYNSGEHGLLIEALAHAIGRELPVLVRRSGREWTILVDPDRLDDPVLAPLKQAAKQLVGRLPSHTGRWAEAVTLHLDWKLDGLWLLTEPRIWMTPSPGRRPVEDMSFVRERRAQRYNKQSHGLLQAWVSVILRGEESIRVSAFGGVDGIDAAFVIDQTTAFSWRALNVQGQAALTAQARVAA